MKISIAGMHGSGKDTIADLLAKKLNLKRYSVGAFRRKMAEQDISGMTGEDLIRFLYSTGAIKYVQGSEVPNDAQAGSSPTSDFSKITRFWSRSASQRSPATL